MEKTHWLVYSVSCCEQGTEGWSGYQHYAVVSGDTDEEIYNNYAEEVKRLYDVDISEYLECRKRTVGGKEVSEWYAYYPIRKTKLPEDVYGHSKYVEVIPVYDKHKE